MPVQICHLNYVVAAAEYGSFRRAAEAIGVQESAISRRIRDLELRLGTHLFVRSTAGVKPTAAGMQFIERSRKALSQISLAKSEVNVLACGEVGLIRIGIFSSLASGFLSDLIATYGTRHRAVQLSFVDGNPADHVASVRRGQLDVAFVTGRSAWAGCQSEQLWSERVFAVLPIGHARAQEPEVRLEDLTAETFVVSESAPGEEIYDFLVKRLADLGHHPKIRQQAVGRDNLIRLVALNCGLTVTSEATTGASIPGVIFRPIAGEVLPFSAVWSPRNDNPALLRLIDLARRLKSDNVRSDNGVRGDDCPAAALSQTHDPSL